MNEIKTQKNMKFLDKTEKTFGSILFRPPCVFYTRKNYMSSSAKFPMTLRF